MRIIAAIPARLNSTRLPKKLLREICGKTLIARTYEVTVNSNLFDDVLVITNSHEIVSELKNSKIKYIFDDANYQLSSGNFQAYNMHNFSVDKVTSFNILAKSEKTIQMISHKKINAFGVSFHPEVRNQEIITNFLLI